MKFQTHCGYTDIFLILDIILTHNPIMTLNSILKSFCNKCKFFFCKKFSEYEKCNFFLNIVHLTLFLQQFLALVFWLFKATVFKISIVYGFKYLCNVKYAVIYHVSGEESRLMLLSDEFPLIYYSVDVQPFIPRAHGSIYASKIFLRAGITSFAALARTTNPTSSHPSVLIIVG